MKKRAAAFLALALCLGPILAGCRKDKGPADLPEDQPDVWRAESEEISSSEKTEPTFSDLTVKNSTVIMYLTRAKDYGLTDKTVQEFKTLTADLKTYRSAGSAYAAYMGALAELSDCVLDFYYLNGTDKLLDAAVKKVHSAHGKLSKLDQTSVEKPSKELITAAAKVFREFGER